MKTIVDRRGALHSGIAVAVSLIVPPARACEFYTANFKIVHPWTRAAGDDATSIAVCMKFDEVTETDRLIGAESPVCTGAEMGGESVKPWVDFLIPAGQTTVMTEAGPHLRLVGLKHALPVGREYPLTLIFKKAGSVSAKLSIDYARFG